MTVYKCRLIKLKLIPLCKAWSFPSQHVTLLEHLSLLTSKPFSICSNFINIRGSGYFHMHSPKRCSTFLDSKNVIDGKDTHFHGTYSLLCPLINLLATSGMTRVTKKLTWKTTNHAPNLASSNFHLGTSSLTLYSNFAS
jgi:hypothetical protein